MEDQTRFDLNAAVENWRQELAAEPNLSAEARRESEGHLREAIAGFQRRGLNAEESFWLARRSVAQPAEFGEVSTSANPTAVWRTRLFWMSAAILFFSSFAWFVESLVTIIIAGCSPHLTHGAIIFTETILTAIKIVPIFLMMFFISRRRLNPQSVLQLPVFRSRLRFGLVAVSLIATLYFFELWSHSRTHMPFVGASDNFSDTWWRTIPDTIIRLLLVGLLVWLKPTSQQSNIELIDLRAKAQTSFDLKAAVENWRQEIAAQPNITLDDRCELETHLLDATAGFQQQGLNAEESFWLARQRVGQPRQLGEEYIKANLALHWRRRVSGMAAAILIFSTWGAFSRLLSSIAEALVSPSNYFHVRIALGALLYIFLVAVMMIYIVRGKMNQRFSFLSSFFHSRLRVGLAAVGLVALLYFLQVGQILWFNRQVTFPKSMVIQICLFELPETIIRLVLVGLLVWFMPRQSQKLQKVIEY